MRQGERRGIPQEHEDVAFSTRLEPQLQGRVCAAYTKVYAFTMYYIGVL